jgi:hypothetical protein
MGDILKEAIADAKAVRETALQNAKMALEEAFTPQLKSMLSAKLKEDEMGDEEPEEGMHDEDMDDDETEEGRMTAGVDDEETEEGRHEEGEHEEEPEEGMYGEDEEEVPAEEGYYQEGEHEDEVEEDDDEGEDKLDLEAIIRELETELSEQDDAYDEKVGKTDASHLAEEDDAYPDDVEGKEDPKHVGGTIGEAEDKDDEEKVEEEYEITLEGEEDDDEDKVDEQSKSSEIGAGDNKVHYASSSDEEDPGDSTEIKALGEQLKEYKQAVHFLKDKLHEVNILNAKLLFTNKLFKSYNLNNNQKLKVVETFDRAQSTREIKLVYSTLAEQFGDNGSITRKHSIKESASSKAGSTKPSQSSRKVITEESKVANRFKKLAGLL